MPYQLSAQKKYEEAMNTIKYFAPKFRTSLKSSSKLHTWIGKLFNKLGNPTYLTSYWTTIGPWCARPSVCNQGALPNEWQILFHEGQHAKDSDSLGVGLFSCLYLFPQILGIVSIVYACTIPLLFMLGGPSWLCWGLVGLVALGPLPAIGRAILEYRGYVVTMAIDYWMGQIPDDQEARYLETLCGQFTGPNYYFMFPFKSIVKWAFKGKLQELKTNTFPLNAYLAIIKSKCFQWQVSS
jgi:hypothetical protein